MYSIPLKTLSSFRASFIKIASADGLFKHFSERMDERSPLTPLEQRQVANYFSEVVQRMNARPEKLFFRNPKTNERYTSSKGAIRRLSNDIAVKMPDGGHIILENRVTDPNKNPRYTVNTYLAKGMTPYKRTKRIGLDKFFRSVFPRYDRHQREAGIARHKASLKPAQTYLNEARSDFGFTGPGGKKSFESASSKILGRTKDLNIERELYDLKKLPKGSEVRALKPLPATRIPMSKQRTRKLERKVLRLAKKGILKGITKVGSSNAAFRLALRRSLLGHPHLRRKY